MHACTARAIRYRHCPTAVAARHVEARGGIGGKLANDGEAVAARDKLAANECGL